MTETKKKQAAVKASAKVSAKQASTSSEVKETKSDAPRGPRRARNAQTTHLNQQEAIALRQWLHIDAKDQVLGKLSAQVAILLRGKHKPQFSAHLDVGDYVVVTNASAVKLTGNKWKQKTYYHHTGYTGTLKRKSAEFVRDRRPEDLIYEAVKCMLPPTRLGRKMFKKLNVFPGPTHTHEAQQPKPFSLNK